MDAGSLTRMALSIRNRETEQAVRALASRTGLTLTEAIDMAVRAQLDLTDVSDEARAIREAHLHRVFDAWREDLDVTALLSDEDLYDEDGLPR